MAKKHWMDGAHFPLVTTSRWSAAQGNHVKLSSQVDGTWTVTVGAQVVVEGATHCVAEVTFVALVHGLARGSKDVAELVESINDCLAEKAVA